MIMQKQRRGFTLVEIMVALALFSILILVASRIFQNSQESLDWNYHTLSLQKELRRTLSTMSQELRESSPSSPTPITTGSNTITFEIPATVSGNAITGWTQITYALSSNNTVTRTANGQTTSIGNNVTALNFLYPVNAVTAPRTMQIQITANQTTLKRNITRTITGQVVLRNP